MKCIACGKRVYCMGEKRLDGVFIGPTHDHPIHFVCIYRLAIKLSYEKDPEWWHARNIYLKGLE